MWRSCWQWLRGCHRLVKLPGDTARTPAELSTPAGLAYNFFASFLGGGASVTPGLDGSYVLLLMRTYNAVIGAVADLMHFQIHWGILITLGVGAVAGIVLFSKLVDTLLRRARGVVYYAILGLVVGALYGLWPENVVTGGILSYIVAFVVGLVVALLLGRDSPQAAPKVWL